MCQQCDSQTLIEIDEALTHALNTRKQVRDSQKHLITEFIDELLDARLELDK